jgi:protein SCO1/2
VRAQLLKCLAAAAVVIGVAGGHATSARADGDPASDFLYSQSIFVPADAGIPAPQQARLAALVGQSRTAGFPIKVAIVSSVTDLGSVGALWHHPQAYARFLGAELSQGYRGPLLIVMPNGFGISGRSAPPRVAAELARTRVSRATLATSAIAAVERVAAAAGHPLHPPPVTTARAERHASSHLTLLLVAIGLLLIAAAWGVSLRLRPWRSNSGVGRLALPLLLGVVVAAAASTATVSALTSRSGSGQAAANAPASAFEGGVLPPGVRAPQFALRDQDGRLVRMSHFLGSPVIVTFMYTHCRNLCPITAQMIRGALDDLGHAVPVIALSVDPLHDTPASARQFLRVQHVSGRIDFLLGTRAELEPLWRGFAIQPQRRHLEHQSWITLVDRRGFQRVGDPIVQTTPEQLAHDVRVLER